MDIKIHYDNKEQCYDFAPIPCRENDAAGGGVAIEVAVLPEPTKDIAGKVYHNTTDGTYYIGVKDNKYSNGYGFEPVDTSATLLDGSLTELRSHTLSVREEAFADNTNLKSIDLPNTVYMGYRAFAGCTALENVNVPNLTNMGDSVFRGCTSLKSISLPKLTGMICLDFEGCTSLETMTFGSPIPPELSGMYDNFRGCPLKAIYVPAESVEAYKTAYEWSRIFADIIQPIPEE